MISVIIPVHNAASYIKNCLKCISQLKYKDYEVVVVDDASTDDSRAIVNEAGFIPIQKDKSEGPAIARNVGAKQARGDVLFFIDSDVYLKPDTLTRIESILNAHPEVAGTSFVYSLEHPNKNLVSLYKNFSIRTEEMAKPDITPGFRFSAFAIKRKTFDIIGDFGDARRCEDLEFSLKAKEHNLLFYIDKEMDVIHAKKYSLVELIKGDFQRGYNYFKVFFKNYEEIRKGYSRMRGSIHLPFVQLLGIGLAAIFLFASFFYATGINLALCFLMMLGLSISQARFLKDAYNAHGLIFSAVSFLLRNLEIAIGEITIFVALGSILLKRSQRNSVLCLLT